MTRFVALLRAVNVGGRKLPMTDLRAIAEGLGWQKVRTYIQSGNLLFEAKGKAGELEGALDKALAEAFGFEVPVIARTAKQWAAYGSANPFPEAAEAEPNRLMLCLSKAPPEPGSDSALQERARDGERVKLAGGALWIHYPAGAGTSRLSPSLIDRLAGSATTARNWRTVQKIGEMLGE